MSTRLYKINGEYNTFEYWHDHYGYTKTPTFGVQYKTTNPWGAAFASDGYYDAEDLMDIFTFSFFVPGVVGWNGIDDLALEGYYPAAATDLTVARDSEVSNAATLTQDNETYYLVQNDIEYGWMSQAEFEARGWSTDVGDPPSYIVFDTTTGTIVHSIIDAGSMITVYETGVKTESFYFTTNGRNETQNTDISHADIPVYLEDGTAPAADTPYNGSPVLAFMDVDGNTKQADGESLYVDNGELRLDAPDTDEGEQWAALVEYIEPAPPAPSFDSATGTISGLTLPTVHSGSYTNVTFDTLRYYVKGTANVTSATDAFFGLPSRTWYYGTIEWTDESLGDLSSLIQVNPTSSNHLVQQTVFRIIFITGGITGYRPYDTGDSTEILNQITAYSYNNGVHSITFYCTENWWQYADRGRIQFRYLDGTTTFNGLDAYDLILVNNGALSKATTTDRYDMYNAWGGQISIKSYYQQTPAPSELTAYFKNTGSAYEYDTQINQGGGANLYAASGATLYYDSSKTYIITGLYNAAGELLTFGDGDSLRNNSTYLFYNRGINLARVFAHHITYTES